MLGCTEVISRPLYILHFQEWFTTYIINVDDKLAVKTNFIQLSLHFKNTIRFLHPNFVSNNFGYKTFPTDGSGGSLKYAEDMAFLNPSIPQ